MALYLSCPAVSQICALIVFASTWMERVANSTPIVDLESRLNSLRVKRLNRLDLPTPESPIRTTARHIVSTGEHRIKERAISGGVLAHP